MVFVFFVFLRQVGSCVVGLVCLRLSCFGFFLRPTCGECVGFLFVVWSICRGLLRAFFRGRSWAVVAEASPVKPKSVAQPQSKSSDSAEGLLGL